MISSLITISAFAPWGWSVSATYKVTVTPSDEFLKRAVYPVVIDPEINIIDGGLIGGASLEAGSFVDLVKGAMA